MIMHPVPLPVKAAPEDPAVIVPVAIKKIILFSFGYH
jgi:hypothetical protein